MWSVWILLAWIWCWLAWSSERIGPREALTASVVAPVFRRNCSDNEIACVDDCSFLCVEKGARCIGGTCAAGGPDRVECDRKHSGMVVMTGDGGSRHWECVCTDPTLYGGPACSTLAPDACRNGVFLYRPRGNSTCLCNFPFRTLKLNGKPHCVDPVSLNFFRDVHDELTIGPNVGHGRPAEDEEEPEQPRWRDKDEDSDYSG